MEDRDLLYVSERRGQNVNLSHDGGGSFLRDLRCTGKQEEHDSILSASQI